MSAHVSMASVRVDLSAPVMCSIGCLCILASLLMKPLVPLPIPKPGTRNRSAAYSILGIATDIKDHLIYLADVPFITLVSLRYCVTHFMPLCIMYRQSSFHHSSWSS